MIGPECLVFFFMAEGHAQLKLKPVGGCVEWGRLSNRWFKVYNSVTVLKLTTRPLMEKVYN